MDPNDSLYSKSLENWTKVFSNLEEYYFLLIHPIADRIKSIDFSAFDYVQTQVTFKELIQNLLGFLEGCQQMEYLEENTKISINSEIQEIKMDFPATFPIILKAFDAAYTNLHLSQNQNEITMENSPLRVASRNFVDYIGNDIFNDQIIQNLMEVMEHDLPISNENSSLINLNAENSTWPQSSNSNLGWNPAQSSGAHYVSLLEGMNFQSKSFQQLRICTGELQQSSNVGGNACYKYDTSPSSSTSSSDTSPFSISNSISPGSDIPSDQSMYTESNPEDVVLPNGFIHSIQYRIQGVLNSLEEWKLNMRNEQRNRKEFRKELDAVFLASVEHKASGIISELLQFVNNENVRGILKRFVPHVLEIVIQPSRVIQYKERFDTSVRLLLDGKLLASKSRIKNANIVTLRIINEDKLDVLAYPLHLKANQNFLEAPNTHSREGLTLKLDPMIIKKRPKRKNKQVNDFMHRVHDETFFVEYTVIVKLKDFKDPIMVSTLSHPIRITVNSKQDPQAWETVIWDNACNRFDICPIRTRPPSVQFGDLVNAMDAFFADTNRSLKFRDYLTIFGFIHPEYVLIFQTWNCSTPITLLQFRGDKDVSKLNLELDFKEKEPNKKRISYFAWLFHLKKFIRNYLMNSWPYESLIVGYLNPEESNRILAKQREGTFLVRFSNKTPNAVTVDWKDGHQPMLKPKPPGIYSIRGKGSELKLMNLNEIIASTKRWKFHYHTQLEKEKLFQQMSNGELQGSNSKYIQSSEYMQRPKIFGYVVNVVLQAKLKFDAKTGILSVV